MSTVTLWTGIRKWFQNGGYTNVEVRGEQVGTYSEEEDDLWVTTYRFIKTFEGEVVVHIHQWSKRVDEDQTAVICRYDSFDSAAEDGFANALMEMRVAEAFVGEMESWRERWRDETA
jgi:hypothetical protein